MEDDPEDGPGFDDAASPYSHEPPPLETFVRLQDQVLRAYAFKCAFTGRQFAAAPAPHPELRVVALRPYRLGGPIHVGNFLPLSAAADEAFSNGHVCVGERFELIVDLSRIDPELVGHLFPRGRVHLPEDDQFKPDLEHFRFHRTVAFRALKGQ